MSSSPLLAALPPLPVDDREIEHLATLFDCLGMGFVAHAADGSVSLRNAKAAALLGDTPPSWLNENGLPLASDEQPLNQALASRQPVHERIIGIDRGSAPPTWFKASALPIAGADGNLRRVLLTLLDVSAQRQLAAEVERLTTTDPLTGLSNQAHIVGLLENEIHRAQRYGTPFALAQIDIDQFLPFCEAHGPKTGDQVLADFGRLLRNSIREIDMVGRIGNDEFLLILPNVRLTDAMIGLERIRALIEAHEFADTRFKLTISGGVTEYTGESAALLIERSRLLLLQARGSGRNRLCLDTEIF